MSKLANITKLHLSISALDQSSLIKKTLFVSLVSASIVIGSAYPSMAKNFDTIEFDKNYAIKDVRKFYSSPVKDLSAILNRTNRYQVELPVYSFVQAKSYIRQPVSKTKAVSAMQAKQQSAKKSSAYDWLSNAGKYSKFFNDPQYSQIPKLSATIFKPTAYNFDYKNIETSVAGLRINNKIAYSFEVITWPNGSVSVPIKTLAEVLDISVTQNHVNQNITFKHPTSGEEIIVDHNKSKVIVGTNVIDVKQPRMVFINEGFIVKDDIFIPHEVARDLLDVKTKFLQDKCAIDLSTSRVLKALVEIYEQQPQQSDFVIEQSLKDVAKEEKESWLFKLKTLRYNVGSNMNQSIANSSLSGYTSFNAGFLATGKFFGGEYNLGANTFYNQNGMQVSNYRASLDYIRPKYELSLGSTNAMVSDLVAPGSNIWGLRFGSVGAATGSSSVPRYIQGNADENTMVEIFIDDVFVDKQMAQQGRYEFDSLNYPTGTMVHIRVDQIAQDGTRKVIYDRKFSQDQDLLAPGQKQFLVFSGVDATALSNSLNIFGDRFDYSYVQPVKWVTGAKFRLGISENFTMGVNVANDYVLRQPSRLLLNNMNKLSSARTYRTGRSSSGQIVTIDFNARPVKNLRLSGELGYSSANSLVDPAFDPQGGDIGGFIGLDYSQPNYSLALKAFNYGCDFYSPGSGGFMDRRGYEINSSWKISEVNFNNSISIYQSNLDNYFVGGRSTVIDYNLYASGNIDEYSTLRAGVRSTGAQNNLYYDRDTTFDVTLTRKLSAKANLNINYAKTIRKTKTPQDLAYAKNRNNRINADLNYNAGKLGTIRLSHEMLMLDPVDRLLMAGLSENYFTESVYSKNIRLTLDRSNKPIKGFTLSPNVGYRYGGDNKGLNFGANLGYMFRSGRQIMLSYAYNASFAKFFPGVFSFGGNKSHSLSFNFMDTLGFGVPRNGKTNNTYQSQFDDNTGVVKGSVFLDLNQNGIKDPGEDGIAGIDIDFQNLYKITTDKSGNFIAANIPQGLRKIGINKDTLPVIYSTTVADALVNVKRSKMYVANLGVIVTPGSISGKVDIQKPGVSREEVVILLLDKNGKEVRYTTTDSTGGYFLEAIPPGEYSVAVDKDYMDLKGLQIAENQSTKVTIPLVVNDFVDVDSINIQLIPKQAQIRKF